MAAGGPASRQRVQLDRGASKLSGLRRRLYGTVYEPAWPVGLLTWVLQDPEQGLVTEQLPTGITELGILVPLYGPKPGETPRQARVRLTNYPEQSDRLGTSSRRLYGGPENYSWATILASLKGLG